MDAAGAEAIPTLPKLRAAMSQRRQSPKPMWRLISRLMGMEMKLQQYEQGRRFCDQAALISGVEGLHRVWDSPQSLPSAEEIANPELWTRRVLATV